MVLAVSYGGCVTISAHLSRRVQCDEANGDVLLLTALMVLDQMELAKLITMCPAPRIQ
jgi:hypothetical protein